MENELNEKALLSELIAIRRDLGNLATKADLGALSDQILGGMGAMMKPPDASSDQATLDAWMDVKNAEIARLTERVDRLSNWYRGLETRMNDFESRESLIVRLLPKIETLEFNARSDHREVTRLAIDQGDILRMLRDHDARLAQSIPPRTENGTGSAESASTPKASNVE